MGLFGVVKFLCMTMEERESVVSEGSQVRAARTN